MNNIEITSHAPVPNLLRGLSGNRLALNLGAVLVTTALLALLAQVKIPLPFTPVPVSGQTFGVFLATLLLGRRLALSSVAAYLTMGAIGLPVFAAAATGVVLSPTTGYLVGMLASAFVVGTLVDRGYAKSFLSCVLLGFVSSSLIFGFGLTGLSFFLPKEALLAAGLYPFLIGDILKTVAASLIAVGSKRLIKA